MSNIEKMNYSIARPYRLTGMTLNEGAAALADTTIQRITYASFDRPLTISGNGYTATLTYTDDYSRTTMTIRSPLLKDPFFKRTYIGNYEADSYGTQRKNIERYYIGGNAYSAPAVYVRINSGQWKLHYIYRDYQGSVTDITDASGTVVHRMRYSPWGKLLHTDGTPYTRSEELSTDYDRLLFLGRGYTGHEYLPWFGLVNMNARLYDPAIGRFLSPDPYVQMPDFSQNFNRYAYAFNNPMKFVDPDGEIAWFIPALIGTAIGGYSGYKIGKAHNATGWKMFGYIAGGAAIGGLSGGAAAGVGALGGAAWWAGAAAGAIGGAGFNGLATGWNGKAILKGAAFGAISGFVGGGIGSAIGGGLGAFAGGVSSDVTNQLLTTGNVNWGQSLLTGAISFGMYHGMQYLQYKSMGGKLGQLEVTYKQFNKVNTAYQRSRFWRREYGVVFNNNGSARISRGEKYEVTLNIRPRQGEFATAHTHWDRGGRNVVHNGQQMITVGGHHSIQDFSIPGYSLVVGRTTSTYSLGGSNTYNFIKPDPFIRFFLYPFLSLKQKKDE